MQKHLLVAALLSLLPAPALRAASLSEAQAAYGIFDVTRAEALYRQVSSDPSAEAKARATADRELARIAWLVDGDTRRAIDTLEASLPNDPDPCPAAHLYARILNEVRPQPAAHEGLERLASACLPIEPGVALERLRSFQLQAARERGSQRVKTAAIALRALHALPKGARASMQGAALQLSLGILANDAEAALAGWRAYLWLDAGSGAPPAFELTDAIVRRRFEAGLSARVSPDDALQFAKLLVRAGFYADFKSYSAVRGLPAKPSEPEWRRLAVYAELREALAREILAHDRAYARAGATDEDAYEKKLSGILARAARQLDPNASDPMVPLNRHFGLWGTRPGKSNGVSGLHLGHTVVDDRQRLTQDGRTGEIRLIVIDNMIHNSFSAWLMDGASAPGGWAVDGATIVQVRPRYLTLIDGFARLAAPGAARRRADAEIERQRVSDKAIARAGAPAFLPGARARLRLKGIDRLAAATRRKTGADGFDLAFKTASWDALIASSIAAHEGRHVLDQATFKGLCALRDDELEYRAKLSELRFAPIPALALSSIYSPLFGGTSGHGIANKRLMTDFANWIASNSDRVEGFEAASTPLEQIDKLHDAQIVAIAASLEPAPSQCGS